MLLKKRKVFAIVIFSASISHGTKKKFKHIIMKNVFNKCNILDYSKFTILQSFGKIHLPFFKQIWNDWTTLHDDRGGISITNLPVFELSE